MSQDSFWVEFLLKNFSNWKKGYLKDSKFAYG